MILLTSSINSVADHVYSRFLKDKEYRRLAFIDTAAEAEEGDKEWLRSDRESHVRQGMEVVDFTFTGKTQQEVEAALLMVDIVYVSGGNAFYLLQQMQESGAFEVIRRLVLQEGKTYLATSAGSMIAGPDISPARKIEDEGKAPDVRGTTGIGMVDFIIMPHWGNEYFKDLYLDRRLEHTYDDPNHKLLFLTDNQYVHVGENGYIRILDITKD